MHTLRAVSRLLRAVLHALHGLALVRWRFPALSQAQRQQRIGWWSRKMLHVLGLKLRVQGEFQAGPKLLAANHVSWLDIMAVHALCPQARFVSKADVRHWPLVGRLVDCAGTLYIERERPRDALRVVHQMAAALQAGDTVAVFPEGTTGEGHSLLPFHANLLQAAVAAAMPVQAVALRYADVTRCYSRAATWLGEDTLAHSLWAIARGRGLEVHLTVLPAVAAPHADRRKLSDALRAQIGSCLPDQALP
jgi:1-acyl-sn-glycerol-3-phosphate acyltransferase